MRTPYFCALIFALIACSQHTSAYDDPWFNPPGGTWVPDAGVVSDMKAALDDSLRPVLANRDDATMPPMRYWFQYLGNGSGVDKTIGIIGYPFPVPPGADASYLGAIIPEQCHVFGIYLPKERRFKELSVGGFHCPPRI
jgi:hypothetical protein